MPPPLHILMSGRCAALLRRSFAVSLAPVQPGGWPEAKAPLLTLGLLLQAKLTDLSLRLFGNLGGMRIALSGDVTRHQRVGKAG